MPLRTKKGIAYLHQKTWGNCFPFLSPFSQSSSYHHTQVYSWLSYTWSVTRHGYWLLMPSAHIVALGRLMGRFNFFYRYRFHSLSQAISAELRAGSDVRECVCVWACVLWQHKVDLYKPHSLCKHLYHYFFYSYENKLLIKWLWKKTQKRLVYS